MKNNPSSSLWQTPRPTSNRRQNRFAMNRRHQTRGGACASCWRFPTISAPMPSGTRLSSLRSVWRRATGFRGRREPSRNRDDVKVPAKDRDDARSRRGGRIRFREPNLQSAFSKSRSARPAPLQKPEADPSLFDSGDLIPPRRCRHGSPRQSSHSGPVRFRQFPTKSIGNFLDF